MSKPYFLRRYFSALVAAAGTVALLIASLLSETFWTRFWWSLGSLLCGALTTAQCIRAAKMAKPTHLLFEHSDWIFSPDDPNPLHTMPYIDIPRSKHRRGRCPRLEFQQVDPIFGVPNFPTDIDDDGNIRITRPLGSSMPPYPTFGVLIHYK